LRGRRVDRVEKRRTETSGEDKNSDISKKPLEGAENRIDESEQGCGDKRMASEIKGSKNFERSRSLV